MNFWCHWLRVTWHNNECSYIIAGVYISILIVWFCSSATAAAVAAAAAVVVDDVDAAVDDHNDDEVDDIKQCMQTIYATAILDSYCYYCASVDVDADADDDHHNHHHGADEII